MIYNPILSTDKELKVFKLFRRPGDTLRDVVCGARGEHDNLGTSVAITGRDGDEHQTP